MIAGRVEKKQALIAVSFRTQFEREVAIECVIDTGFTGELSLPFSAVGALGLPTKFSISARLANGALVIIPVHDARVIWEGLEQQVQVLATGDRPLIGTALLDGFELVVQFAEGGLVTVEPL